LRPSGNSVCRWVARQELPATGVVDDRYRPPRPSVEPQGRATRNSQTDSITLENNDSGMTMTQEDSAASLASSAQSAGKRKQPDAFESVKPGVKPGTPSHCIDRPSCCRPHGKPGCTRYAVVWLAALCVRVCDRNRWCHSAPTYVLGYAARSAPISQTLLPGVFWQLVEGLCVLRIAAVLAGKYRCDIVLILATVSSHAVDWKRWGVLPEGAGFRAHGETWRQGSCRSSAEWPCAPTKFSSDGFRTAGAAFREEGDSR
jgi:hypothetical protein